MLRDLLPFVMLLSLLLVFQITMCIATLYEQKGSGKEMRKNKSQCREGPMFEWISCRGAGMDGVILCQAADKLGVAQIALVS